MSVLFHLFYHRWIRSLLCFLVSIELALGSIVAQEATVPVSVLPLDLRVAPSHEQLIAAGQLGGPLTPTAPLTELAKRSQDGADRQAFGTAIQLWNAHDYRQAAQELRAFLTRYPNSAWAGEAELHLGCEAKFNLRHREARDYLQRVVARAAASKDPSVQHLAHKAESRLAVLSIMERDLSGAAERFTKLKTESHDWRLRTYATNWLQRLSTWRHDDGGLWDCGVRALMAWMNAEGKEEAARQLWQAAHTQKDAIIVKMAEGAKQAQNSESVSSYAHRRGLNLTELRALAKQQGYRLEARHLVSKQLAILTLPAVVHVKTSEAGAGHYWLLEAVTSDRLTLYDAQLERRFSHTLTEFEQAWTGWVLARADGQHALPGRAVSDKELATVRGGCCGIQRPESELGYSESTLAPRVGRSCSQGAPSYAVNLANMNLVLSDTPLWYENAIGPNVQIALHYNSQSALNQYEPFGSKWSFAYASYLVVDPGGAVTVFMPDGRRDVYVKKGDQFQSPLGVSLQLTAIGEQRYELKDRLGEIYEYAIPPGTSSMQPFLVAIRDAHGQRLQLEYDTAVRLVGIRDALGRVTQLLYDARNLVQEVRDPFGRVARFEYNDAKHLVRIVDMGGYATQLTYDKDVYLTSMSNAQGAWQFYIEPADGINNGMVIYPAPGGVMWEDYRITVTDPEGGHYEYYYDGYRGISWFVDAAHYVPYQNSQNNNADNSVKKTSYAWEKLTNRTTRIKRISYPDDTYLSYIYDPLTGRPTSVKDNWGTSGTFVWNAQGRLLSWTDRMNQEIKWSYDTNGVDATSIQSPFESWALNYNAAHQPTQLTDALGRITTLQYNAYGQVTAVRDASGQSNVYQYNAQGQLQRVVRGNKVVAKYGYDPIGRVQAVTDMRNVTYRYAYSPLNELTEVIYPDGRKESYRYGSCPWRVESMQTREGRGYDYRYDKVDRLREVVGPAVSDQLRFSRDAKGRVTTVSDAQGEAAKYLWDPMDRVSEVYYRGKLSDTYRYQYGRLYEKKDARDIRTYYRYDDYGQLSSIDYSDATPDVRLAYDAAGRLIKIDDGLGAHSWQYDAHNRLLTWDNPWANDTWQWTYDVLDRVESVQINGEPTVHYQYDVLGRVQAIVRGESKQAATFRYEDIDAAQGEQRLYYPNNLLQTRRFDALGRLREARGGDASTGRGVIMAYDYGVDDRLSQVTITHPLAFPKLTVGKHAQRYDAGDLLRSRIPSQQAEHSFEHDAAGNITKGILPKDQAFKAHYDAENRLDELRYRNAQNQEVIQRYRYRYDHTLGRVETFVNNQKQSEARWLRWGVVPVQERDGQDQVLRSYLWGRQFGGGIDGLLSIFESGKRYDVVGDGHGHTQVILDEAQQRVASYRYDPYGQIVAEEGSYQQPLRYAGKVTDVATGLVDFGYRMYAPHLGRWLQRDPLGLAGGDTNLYAYVRGDPANYVDPTGEHPLLIVMAIGAGIGIGTDYGFSRLMGCDYSTNDALVSGAIGAIPGSSFLKLGKLGKIVGKGGKILERPSAIPSDWIAKQSKKGGGIQYINPNNPHDRVRIMPGNPNSLNPSQQIPYVKRQIDGKFYDIDRRIVPGDSPEAHIPLDQFKF